MLGAIELASILLLIGLYDVRRFSWALRGLSLLVFAAYAMYFVYEAFVLRAPFRLLGPRGEESTRNSILGLIFIGLPCLGYALHGKFSSEETISELSQQDHLRDEDQ